MLVFALSVVALATACSSGVTTGPEAEFVERTTTSQIAESGPIRSAPPDTVAPVSAEFLHERYEQVQEHLRYLETCMRETGFEMTFDGVSGFVIDPGSQQEAFDSALTECDDLADTEAPQPPKVDRETAYRMALAIEECLESEGFEIPDAPSLDAYLESWGSGPWHPYQYIPLRGEALADLNKRCPQF
jgi:hypothetical protein